MTRFCSMGALLSLGVLLAFWTPNPHALAQTGTPPDARPWHDLDALSAVFQGLEGRVTFVVHDPETGDLWGYDQNRAQVRYRPASTFKIPNSLIALETGVVNSVDQILPCGNRPLCTGRWAHDMPLGDAIKVSDIPIFQGIARRIGRDRMTHWLGVLSYGNGETGSDVETFWLDGPLAISALEQVAFLDRVVNRDPVFSATSYDALFAILPREALSPTEGTLVFKTGLTGSGPPPQTGWVVGWLETPGGKVYPFAFNMDIRDPQEADLRLPLAKSAIQALVRSAFPVLDPK